MMSSWLLTISKQEDLFLYDIHSIYFYLHFVLGVQPGYDMQSRAAVGPYIAVLSSNFR